MLTIAPELGEVSRAAHPFFARHSIILGMSENAALPDPSDPQKPNDPAHEPGQPAASPDQPAFQPFRHDPVSARVPERVSKGVFATALIVQEGNGEFVLDFVQSLTRPPQIAARVVVPPAVMQSLVTTFAENLQRYKQTIGPLPTLPKPPANQRPPSMQELYDHFKLPDDQLSGTYANSVLIGHQAAEFFLDFITTFYPTAAVSNRIYLSAAQAPKVHEILAGSLQQHQRRVNRPAAPPNPAPDVPQ